MITDVKITGYRGIAGHFSAANGRSVILMAETLEDLKMAAKQFTAIDVFNPDKCQRCIIIAASALPEHLTAADEAKIVQP